MPGYKTHLCGGLVAYGVLAYLLSMPSTPVCTFIEWACFACAGSLFPDIDTKSKGQKWLYWFISVCFLVLLACKRFTLVAILSIAALVPMLVSHRGLFHRLWFILAFTVALIFIGVWRMPQYAHAWVADMLFFALGAISHLWLDLGMRRMLLIKKRRSRW